MTHTASYRPEITPNYRQQAEREIRLFTRDWTARDDRIASASYFGTFIVYFATLYIGLALWGQWWAVAVFVVLNAFAGVRLYVLQHDCGHASLFSTKGKNDVAGHVLSVFTLTPYRVMQVNHNSHHSHLGNLDERDTTEIFTMTKREWDQAGFGRRVFYRIYRNPFILIPIGGVFTYVIAYRWPKNAAKIAPLAVLAHNLGLLAWVGVLWLVAGLPGLIFYAATVTVAACLGVFLVYLQHNFEDTWWDRKPKLNPARAALQGSSALDLGWWWDLGTGNIAYHDIHHFNANIPSYRLRKCHRALREKYQVQTIGWRQAIRSFRLKLWDEDEQRLVPFPKAQTQSSGALRGA